MERYLTQKVILQLVSFESADMFIYRLSRDAPTKDVLLQTFKVQNTVQPGLSDFKSVVLSYAGLSEIN